MKRPAGARPRRTPGARAFVLLLLAFWSGLSPAFAGSTSGGSCAPDTSMATCCCPGTTRVVPPPCCPAPASSRQDVPEESATARPLASLCACGSSTPAPLAPPPGHEQDGTTVAALKELLGRLAACARATPLDARWAPGVAPADDPGPAPTDRAVAHPPGSGETRVRLAFLALARL